MLDLRASARHPNRRLAIFVDGTEVAAGVGGAAWAGPLLVVRDPIGPVQFRVEARGGLRKRTATLSVAPGEVMSASIELEPPGASYAPSQIAVRIAEAGCLLPDAGRTSPVFSLRLDDHLDRYELLRPGVTALTSAPMWEGAHHLDAAVTWSGWTLATASVDVVVPEAPFDADEDGVTSDLDCDDHDPWSRPGLPDVPYDGRDNDCDGLVAGDADGDGYDVDRTRTKLDEAARERLSALYPDTAARVASTMLGLPRLRESDCDDRSAATHPWATGEGALACGPSAAAIGGESSNDPGGRPATADWLGTAPATRTLELSPHDVDVLAFAQPGVGRSDQVALSVDVDGGPVWVELWRGGERVVVDGETRLGPLLGTTPLGRWRVVPGAPLDLPLRRDPVPSATAALWTATAQLVAPPEDGPAFAAFATTALFASLLTPGTLAFDLDTWITARRARVSLSRDELLYLWLEPASPRGIRHVHVTTGR